MTTRVLPIVARTGVNLDDVRVRQEDVRRVNLCVAAPVDNAFGQRLIPMGATVISNITKAGNIKWADPVCQRLPTSISIPRGHDHPPLVVCNLRYANFAVRGMQLLADKKKARSRLRTPLSTQDA